ADKYVQQAIQCHEHNQLEKAAHFFRLAACQGSPVGLFLYGISLRHGWGCKVNPQVAFQCLQKAAEYAVFDLNNLTNNTNLSAAKHELVLAIYELGVCFQHGWGVSKNKSTAVYYFEIAANLGDPDAQNDLAFCYLHGHGVRKNRHKAAKYYRMAHAQGMGVVGNSWIFKAKYD
ncbi:HCP-like protein, partial [Basidiobolus meristosporus CBS 931.73]